MCLQPIKIANRKRLVNLLTFCPYIFVPCGQCPSCRSKKQHAAVTRAYYECKAHKFTYFDTLTYSNAYLPHYNGLPCFDRYHVTTFFKRLRISLERAGYHVKGNLKYFLVSEYGGLAHRPHYHVLFFSNVPGLTPHKLWYYTRKTWKYGFNDPYLKIQEHIVNSEAALAYVAKYVTKDIVFEDKYKKVLCNVANMEDSIETQRAYRSLCPFTRSSLNFGFEILKLAEKDFEAVMKLGVPLFGSKGKHYYPIPDYLKHLLNYEKRIDPRVPEGSFMVKNSRAIEYMLHHLDDSISNFGRGCLSVIETAKAYNVDVPDILLNLDIRQFSIYKLVYQGHMYDDTIDLDLVGYKNFFYRCLLDDSGDELVDSPMIHKKVAKAFIQDSREYCICQTSHPSFAGLDDADEAIMELSKYINSHRIELDKIKQQQKLKSRLIYEKYG